MNFKVDKINDNLIYGASYKICTQIAKDQDKVTLQAIKRYCEENDIIPNIINEDKLKLILKLGIEELNKRKLEKVKD